MKIPLFVEMEDKQMNLGITSTSTSARCCSKCGKFLNNSYYVLEDGTILCYAHYVEHIRKIEGTSNVTYPVGKAVEEDKTDEGVATADDLILSDEFTKKEKDMEETVEKEYVWCCVCAFHKSTFINFKLRAQCDISSSDWSFFFWYEEMLKRGLSNEHLFHCLYDAWEAGRAYVFYEIESEED